MYEIERQSNPPVPVTFNDLMQEAMRRQGTGKPGQRIAFYGAFHNGRRISGPPLQSGVSGGHAELTQTECMTAREVQLLGVQGIAKQLFLATASRQQLEELWTTQIRRAMGT